MARWFIPTGILPLELNQMQVFADSTGMQVKVKTGRAWIRGHYFSDDAQETLAIATSNPTNPRIDLVVLKADFVNNTIDYSITTGTPASSPATPSLTQSSTVWEIPLASVRVDAAASTIAATKVTDLRLFSQEVGINVITKLHARAYGVAADGTTDDSANLQRAMNALTSGVDLVLPEGTCYTGANTLYLTGNNVGIIGAGKGKSWIKGAAAAGIMQIGSGDPPVGGIDTTFRDFGFYQTYAGATPHSIIFANGKNMVFEDVYFKTDGSAAASTAYFINYSISAGNTSDLELRHCTLENLATLTAIQVSGVVWRSDGLTIEDCEMITVNNPIVPTSDCNKSRLSYQRNKHITRQRSVDAEGPDICNWSDFIVKDNSDIVAVIAGDTTLSQGGMLIECGGASNFAGVSKRGIVKDNIVRGGSLFLVCDQAGSNASSVADITFEGNIVDKIRTFLGGSMEVTGSVVAGNAHDIRISGNIFPDGFYEPGTTVDNITNLDRYDNVGADAWTAFTPTITHFTLGNGAISAKYKKVGKIVHIKLLGQFGSTTSISGGSADFSLPFAPTTDYKAIVGTWFACDSSVGSFYGGTAIGNNAAGSITPWVNGTVSGFTATSPMTWATGDYFGIELTYEAA